MRLGRLVLMLMPMMLLLMMLLLLLLMLMLMLMLMMLMMLMMLIDSPSRGAVLSSYSSPTDNDPPDRTRTSSMQVGCRGHLPWQVGRPCTTLGPY